VFLFTVVHVQNAPKLTREHVICQKNFPGLIPPDPRSQGGREGRGRGGKGRGGEGKEGKGRGREGEGEGEGQGDGKGGRNLAPSF
jgi:hypothetical protein